MILLLTLSRIFKRHQLQGDHLPDPLDPIGGKARRLFPFLSYSTFLFCRLTSYWEVLKVLDPKMYSHVDETLKGTYPCVIPSCLSLIRVCARRGLSVYAIARKQIKRIACQRGIVNAIKWAITTRFWRKLVYRLRYTC
jgi:hypothetical protein